jgi:hypothetical protein
VILSLVLLVSCVAAITPEVDAAKKETQTRAIAIVYDNSGSMYLNNNVAWCRATYAMEVFGSMLNKGDILLIYPMYPFTVDGKEYSMESPLRITDATKASTIRENFTENPGGTPIETIDAAAEGLKTVTADKKYMVVLTDGDAFWLGGKSMSADKSKKELDARIKKYAGADMTVMYLGIGKNALLPNTAQSEYFAKKKASDSADVLSSLTEMCNQIFGRDTLPKNRISGNSINFDISMSKLIVFVQGENVADLKVTGSAGAVGKQESALSTKYGTAGSGKYKNVMDTSLQGMLVTYTDCSAGTYTIEHTGSATSVEVYYEPNADLDFVFTDANGNMVDPANLYEGDYKVSFGMKDGKTGKLISSDLLGEPKYEGSYFINGEEHKISQTGYSGEVPVSLKMGDTFKANLTVTYLSGYTIRKDSTDFGWPASGINVVARPAGMLQLKITGGEDSYSLQELEEGEPYIAEIFYEGEKLTGDALESASLKWDPDTSNAEIKKTFAGDHYKLSIHYKDPSVPQNTKSGECTVTIYAFYSAAGSAEAQAQDELTYDIDDDFSPLKIELVAKEDYIVISELKQGKEIQAKLTVNGKELTAEEFAATKISVDCGGIEYTLVPHPEESSYTIILQDTPGIGQGDYDIEVSGEYTDKIGRTTKTEQSVPVTLSTMPMWLKWLIILGILLLILFIIWRICRIPALPKYVHANTDMSVLDVGDGPAEAEFQAKVSGKSFVVDVEYGGSSVSSIVMEVEPGPGSCLSTPQNQRSMVTKHETFVCDGDLMQIVVAGSTFTIEDGVVTPVNQNQEEITITDGDQIKLNGYTWATGKKTEFEAKVYLSFEKE